MDRHFARAVNARADLTEAERAAAAAALDAHAEAAGRRDEMAEEADAPRARLSAALSSATREAVARAVPEFADVAGRLRAEIDEAAATLKGGGGSGLGGALPTLGGGPLDRPYFRKPWLDTSFSSFREKLRWRDFLAPIAPVTPVDPPFARDFWWAETGAYWNDGGLAIDLGDPYRIWGHIDYQGDPLISRHVGLAFVSVLSPDRFPVAPRGTRFVVRPVIRTAGEISGWTGGYHWLWAADDKWCNVWMFRRATVRLGTGEVLAETIFAPKIIGLENVSPVGQYNGSLFAGWEPVLFLDADLADLRARGVPILLELELRFDIQLEGDAAIWIRNRPGSAAESVPGPDNALRVRFWPGSLDDWS